MKKNESKKIEDTLLDADQIDAYSEELGSKWQVIGHHHLQATFSFKDFKTALFFVNEVGSIAEGERHHPDITLSYGQVIIKVFTHRVDGLSLRDFELAKKINTL